MIQIHRRQALCSLMALMAGFRSQAASAQAMYPTRPIRVIVPFPAGGVGDTVIRVLAPTIEKKLGQKLVIESKPGAAGNIGMSGSRARRARRLYAARCDYEQLRHQPIPDEDVLRPAHGIAANCE